MTPSRRLSWGLFALVLACPLVSPLHPTPAPAKVLAAREPVGPYEQELDERRARWRAQAGKPQAALAVIGAMALWDLTDPAAVSAFVDQAAADAGAHPLARAHAQFQAQTAAVWRGDRARAARLRADLGLIETWKVIGPFGFEGGDLIGTPYGPEGQPMGTVAVEKGKRGDVAWRDVPGEWLRDGVVPFAGMLRPDTQAAGYAMTWVWSDRPRDVAVRLGSSGATRVWVNRALAVDHRVKHRPLALDQDAAAARLAKGWNEILVKVAVEDGGWGFLLRLTEPGGAPLALKVARTPPAGEPMAPEVKQSPAKEKQPKAPAHLGTLLAAAATRKPGKKGVDHAAIRDLAYYLDWISPEDPETRPVEAALEPSGWASGLAPAETLLFVARHAETADVRRRAADALAADQRAPSAWRAEAHWLLALYYDEEAGMPRRARSELLAATQLAPGFWPATLSLAEHVDALGLGEVALARLRQLVERRPHAGTARRALARLEEGAGRPEAARAHYEHLLAADADDVFVMARLADLARSRRDDPARIAYLRQIVAVRPTSVGAALDLAETLRDLGDVPGALAALDAALLVAPDDPRLLEESGRTLVERGDAAQKAEGLARLKHALAIRPQNPELRRYLAKVAPTPGDDLEKLYGKKVPALIDAWADWQTQGNSVVVLLDQKVTRVHANGLSEVFVQRVVRVQDETGAEEEKWQGVQFSPDTQTVEVRAARVYKPSGEIVEAKLQGTREVSEPWYGLYYDVRADMTGFERLEPGDVVEYSYVLSDTGRRNLYADYFGDLHFLAGAVPVAEAEYTLIAPPSRKLYWRLPKLAGLERKDDVVHGEQRTRVRATRIAKIQPDPGMPGWTEAAPYVHVSTYASWDQVARWYWRLVEEQLVADEAVRRAAKAAVAGLTDEKDKVRAIHNLVVKSTRYVGLEFGIHSFKPYRVPTVFERKFGDCKDKASLTVVMLREVGIPAQLILVRTRKNGDVDEQPASLAVFDHAIAYVPSLDLYLDGTAEFSGSRELPHQDQGIMVLRIDGGDGKLTRTPVLPATENVVTRRTRIAFGAGGAAEVAEDVEVRGQTAAIWRQHYQTPGERPGRYEKAWNANLPGVKLKAVTITGTDDLEAPVVARAEGQVPVLGAAAPGGGWTLPPMGRPSELLRSYARTSKRQHDLLIDFPWSIVETVEITLPEGVKLRDLPESGAVETPFGHARLKLEVKDGPRPVVTVSTELVMVSRRVTVPEYAAFRDFLGKVDGLLNQPLEWVQK